MLVLQFLFLLAVHLHAAPPCAARDTVSPGNGLAGIDSRLVSNNSKFALGFFKPDSKSQHTYLCIWYYEVPVITPVWSANGESPGVDPASPELAIAGDGNLAILDRATKRVTVTTNDTVAALTNSGNLVLRSAANASVIFWQSFDHPTDTLLPGAKIGWDRTAGLNRRLVSRRSLTDQAPGLYALELGRDRVGRLVWNDSAVVEYWTSGEWDGQFFSLTPEMTGAVLPSIRLAFFDTDDESTFTYTLRDETAVVRCAIDVYGQALVGVWLAEPVRNWMIWLVSYRQPILPCDVYAACGPFTICTGNATASTQSPICGCMKGFSLGSPADWEVGDRRHGCGRRNTPLAKCGGGTGGGKGNKKTGGGVADKFYPVQSVRLPHGGTKVPALAASRDACERVCLGNCSCTAYSYCKSGCSVWHGPLYNVKQLDSSDGNAQDVLYIRLAAAEVPPEVGAARKKKQSRVNVVSAAVGGAGAVALVLLAIVGGLAIWTKKRTTRLADAQDGGVGIISFRYADLQRATKNFTQRLGGGGFGSVFKGYLNNSTDGSAVVALAVKRLDGVRQGEKQFRAEVSSVGITQHINLVRLIGFCCEGDNRLLVYEFMPNQSLDVHLFKPNNYDAGSSGTVLDWSLRYQIAVGVARGLAYLNTGCRDCIIHCDIKPENILLDVSFVPKIADFGMAKVLGREFSQAVTTMRGTVGYLAPEWIAGAPVTAKVDVYSYGMVLFEIVSGRRSSSSQEDDPQGFADGDYSAFFPLQAARKLHNGEVASLMDSNLRGDVNVAEVERVCRVACWCIQDNELERPTMAEVVQFLEGVTEVDMPPVPRLLNAITSGADYSPSRILHT